MIHWPMLAVYVQASGVPWLHACMAMHGLSPMNIVQYPAFKSKELKHFAPDN